MRGPKQPLPPFTRDALLISAVSRITSLSSGGDFSNWDFWVWKASFWSLERPASNCETACARRISGFKTDALARALDMLARFVEIMDGGEARLNRLLS